MRGPTGLTTFLLSLLLLVVPSKYDLLNPQVDAMSVQTLDSGLDLDLLPTLEMLLKSNSCPLPCWAGLSPGSSRIENVADWLISTGFDRDWYSFEDYYRRHGRQFSFHNMIELSERFGLSFETSEFLDFAFPSFVISFVFQVDQLQSMTLGFTRSDSWYSPAVDAVSPVRLLRQLSDATHVYFLFPTAYPDEMSLIFYNEEQGTYLYYRVNISHQADVIDVGFCARLTDIDDIEIWLTHPGNNPSFSYFKAQMRDIARSDDISHTPYELWGITTQQFIHALLADPRECFSPQAIISS